MPITIDSPWAGDVTITIEVTDGITIPGTFPLGPGGAATDCQDAKTTLTMTWKKATKFPKTMTPDKQDPGKLEVIQTTDSLTVWYIFGPDTNGMHTNYKDVSVDELFGTQTSNLKTEWVSAANQAAHMGWGDADWVKFFFSSTGANVSFQIGGDDHISDVHGGRCFGGFQGNVTDLSDAGKKATIYVDLPQTYEVPPGTTVGSYTIRRQRTGTNTGDGTYQIRKWKP